MERRRTDIETLKIIRAVKEALESKKAEDIVVLDVQGISSITDYYIIATGNNAPHLRALLREVEREISTFGVKPFRRAGNSDSQWVVADYFDFVIHIFSPDTRRYYELERLWGDARRVE